MSCLWFGQGDVGTSVLNRNIEDHSAVDAFLRERYLFWVEALSLLRGMTEGILAIQKLEFVLRVCIGHEVCGSTLMPL
jgi:hypothetical protein